MYKQSARTIKKQRPVWWSPEGVIERLQNGTPIVLVCQTAAAEMLDAGITISVSRLRGEVSAWAESLTWGEQLTAALKLFAKSGSGGLVLSKTWHDDFITAMESEICNGNAEIAAKVAGIGYGVVLAVLDKRNKCYDAEFAERFRIAELERVGRIREKYLATAEDVSGLGGKLALRAQERVIESAMPNTHGRQQEVRVSGKIDHDHEHSHTHLHGMAPDLAREVVIHSQQRVRRLNAGRQGLLPADPAESEGRVIDVTAARGRVEKIIGSRGVAALEGAIDRAMDEAMPIIRDSMDSQEIPS